LVEQCTFCKIARKELSASHVYEDDKTIAFLDFRPLSEGHTLIVPKKHYENIHETPDEEVAYLFKIVKKVATAVKKDLNADGISVFQNNGPAAGQVVFHIHVHVIPRFEAQKTRQRRNASREELDVIAERIRQHLV
jgi:histidine triad (HIT) family protein